MNGDLSPAMIIKQLVDAGYKLIAVNVPSPVGRVPKGSTVITDHEAKRAYWIDGKLFQHPKASK